MPHSESVPDFRSRPPAREPYGGPDPRADAAGGWSHVHGIPLDREFGSEDKLLKVLALAAAAILWLSCIHLVFGPNPDPFFEPGVVSPKARMMAEHLMARWTEPALLAAELRRMERPNEKWDLYNRTFLAMALANLALRDPSYTGRACVVMDTIIDNTLRIRKEKGAHHFLPGVGPDPDWENTSFPASQLLNAHLEIMIASRLAVEERIDYGKPLREMMRNLGAPSENHFGCGESYPRKCLMLPNIMALAGYTMYDALEGTNHGSWMAPLWRLKFLEKLSDERTRLLYTGFTIDGYASDGFYGPEGSSIWLITHLMQLFDPELAKRQYRRAREALYGTFLGLGYSREWPRGASGSWDEDSGVVVPVLGASAKATLSMVVAAAAFEDQEALGALLASVELLGLPHRRGDRLSYRALAGAKESLLFYAMVQGPLWDRFRELREY